MHCPFCPAVETKVVDSRLNQNGDITRRRRECPQCEGRFTTYERVEEVMPVVIKKDGRRESFVRSKVLDGIQKSCQKRPITVQQTEDALRRIERQIQSYGLKELPARTIGQMVMQELRRLDPVAYVRFASVYRHFRDVEEFVSDLQTEEPTSLDQDPSLLAFPFVANSGTDSAKNSP
jgi:transcriptional repressor NrdR